MLSLSLRSLSTSCCSCCFSSVHADAADAEDSFREVDCLCSSCRRVLTSSSCNRLQ